jgi:molybdate transport system substrate-binding protein
MRYPVPRICAAIALTCATLASGPALADEIRLLSAAAMQSVFKEIGGDFERTSGHKLRIAYGTIGGISSRVLEGERADVVIGSTLSFPELVRRARIDPASQVTICTTGIGVVVPGGSAPPPMASSDDLKAALLAAKVVVYADPVRGGAAGVHIGRVLRDLGIADKLRQQITLAAGGDVTEVTLAQGPGALGMTQIGEIVGKAGAQYAGPLPAAVQNYTTFVAGTPAGEQPSQAVLQFLAFLRGPEAAAAIRAKGMEQGGARVTVR